MTRAARFQFQPLTAERWPDLEALFGPRGACGGCWCMTWRRSRPDFEANKGAGNKRAFKKVVAADQQPGVIAYHKGEPIAWCAIAPRSVYVTLERSRVLKPIDDQPVWSITCLYIRRDFRRRGVSSMLIDAAVRFAAARGATIIEGYPVEPYTSAMPDAFAWTGIPASFHKAGFTEVARRSKTRPIMRKSVSTRTPRRSIVKRPGGNQR